MAQAQGKDERVTVETAVDEYLQSAKDRGIGDETYDKKARTFKALASEREDAPDRVKKAREHYPPPCSTGRVSTVTSTWMTWRHGS